jgi:3-oxoacyl-[acyl-carrier protein] reductase
MNLGSESSIKKYIASIQSPIHILVNNAGINPLAEIGKIDFEKAKELMDVNVWAPVLITNLLADKMKSQRYGRIVNISSIWSVVSKPGRSMYAASKAAINSFTRSASVELGAYNILVNAVAPGYVNTELTRQNNSPEQIEAIRSIIPVNRLAEPSELAELIYFLCSEKNTYVTGQSILADGGFSII